MKSGTIFDNVLICNDEEYAEKFGEDTWGQTKGPEKEMKDEVSSSVTSTACVCLPYPPRFYIYLCRVVYRALKFSLSR